SRRRIFGQSCSNVFAKWPRVRAPLKIDQSASDLGVRVTRSQEKRAVEGSSHRPKLVGLLIAERDFLEDEKVARIQRESPLQVPRGFAPKALASVDIAAQLENLRVVRQRALSDGEFRAGLFVVEITAVKEISPS